MYKCFCGVECTSKQTLGSHVGRMHKELTTIEKAIAKFKIIAPHGDFKQVLDDYIGGRTVFYELPVEAQEIISAHGKKRSSKEERATVRYQDKYRAAIIEKFGVENISQSEIVKKKKDATFLKNHGIGMNEYLKNNVQPLGPIAASTQPQYKLKQNYENASATLYHKYGVSNPSQMEKVREINSAKQKAFWCNKTYDERVLYTSFARSRITHISKIEQRVKNVLEQHGIVGVYNKHLFGYSWDIRIGNTLIEVNGIYWHAKPTIYKNDDVLCGNLTAGQVWLKDRIKKETAQSNGFQVIYIWEDDINKWTDQEIYQFLDKEMNHD